VGKVDAFRIAGLDLWFNSADHKPPHFHAERAGIGEVRLYFLRAPSQMIEKKWGYDLSKAEQKKLLELAEGHRTELLKEWEHKVFVKDLGPDK